uniref:Glutathione peroxidase n=1 Tax=Pohlia nutans TaxID=140635 RepID=A0A4D6QFW8_9BRYO|nr:ascorbate peroxidase [Pohlia nutans]
MALFAHAGAVAAAVALPAALCRLSSRSPSFARSTSSSSSSASSVFGHRLLGLTLGTAASSSSVRAMDTNVSASAAQVTSGNSIYDFVVKDINGNDVEMGVYKGKVLLIVNVASACGLTTTNYKELAELYSKYKDQDFEVLAFPCNQFGGQEPGTNEQIKEFACTRFKAEYPIFDKINVNGSQEAPLYKFLKAQKGGGMLGDGIKWNFAKFLVDKNGNVVDRYAPTTPPSKIEKDIKKYLSS